MNYRVSFTNYKGSPTLFQTMPTFNDNPKEAIESIADNGIAIFTVIQMSNDNLQININGELITEDSLDELFDAIRASVLTPTT